MKPPSSKRQWDPGAGVWFCGSFASAFAKPSLFVCICRHSSQVCCPIKWLHFKNISSRWSRSRKDMQQSKLKSKLFFLLIFSYSISHHEMRTLFFIFLEMISGSTLYPSSNFYGSLKWGEFVLLTQASIARSICHFGVWGHWPTFSPVWMLPCLQRHIESQNHRFWVGRDV